jgi:hypothetical protein
VERHRKKIILLVLLLVAVVLIMVVVNELQRVGINQGYEPDQPIAFSHKTHAGVNDINCLYCHFGAEKSRHAGIPPTNVCLNCHSVIKKDSPEIAKIYEALKKNKPIEWNKVHNLPDYVYFNHSQHVQAGVSCMDCHGNVESMTRMRQDAPLTMGWCIECHRDSGITPGNDHISSQGERDGKAPPAWPVEGATQAPSRAGLDCAKCHY